MKVRGKRVSLIGAGMLLVAASFSSTVSAAPKEKVTVCHATSSDSKPYIQQEPAKDSDVGGHDGHDGDIIPPFEFEGGSYPGKNWTAEGQAIYDNDCVVPDGNDDPAPTFDGGEADLTDLPTDTFGETGSSSPSGGAWLLVVALGVLLASVVVLTPARAPGRR